MKEGRKGSTRAKKGTTMKLLLGYADRNEKYISY
jgi:hypothetical protein